MEGSLRVLICIRCINTSLWDNFLDFIKSLVNSPFPQNLFGLIRETFHMLFFLWVFSKLVLSPFFLSLVFVFHVFSESLHETISSMTLLREKESE